MNVLVRNKFKIEQIVLIVLFFIIGNNGFAQVTTGSIEGVISSNEESEVAFATVVAFHVPTGTKYGASSMNNGKYVIDNLKPGGPYNVTASFVGLKDAKFEGVYVVLGKATDLNFHLKESSIELEGIEVNHDRNDVFQNNKKGVSSNIDALTIQNSPSLNRSLQDVTRLVPQGGQSSFGGSNYRYNNLSIDGASNNDVLGFQEPASGASGSVASNTPGALAGTQPISLDAVQEVQVAIAPFDVKLGNFTGASLNAVTRSGSNSVEGSVYFFGRNQTITGKSVDESRKAIAAYHDLQTGVRIGAPIIKNRLFFFGNYEKTSRREPILNAPGDAETQISFDLAEEVHQALEQKFGASPGSYGTLFNERKSDKFFFRLDYHLSDKHQLTLRDNYVVASADNLSRGASFLKYSSQGFKHESRTNSLVAEVKSRFGNGVFNHLILGYNTVNDERNYEGDVLPHVEITHNSANTIFAGTYREASIYGLTLNTTQLTNNLKIYRNKHKFTLGTNNDFYNIEYRFLTAWNGRWEYKTLNDFYNDQPSRIRGVYNYSDNSFEFNKSNPSADFRVMLLSAYAQDEYQWNDRLRITAGVRLDMQVHPDKVPINSKVVSTPEFSKYNNEFGGVPQINPRVGVQYTLGKEKKAQLRGGTGLFTGRIPFAWYAYSHYISGHNYGNIDLRPSSPIAITSDLSTLRQFQPNLTEINLIDNNFKLPRSWKTSLALDLKLPKEVLFTIEGMYSKVISDISFQSLNLKNITQNYEGADNRPYYSEVGADKKVNSDFTNVFLLTNTKQGYQYFVTASAKKNFGKSLKTMIAYTYGESKDVMNGVRNSLAANFNWNQAVESNDPGLSWSNFDVRHRVISSLNYEKLVGKKNLLRIGVIYSGRSGVPFSYTVAGDLNKDGSSKNDLFFVPTSKQDIVLQDIKSSDGTVVVTSNQQWEQLDHYISNDAYLSSKRGEYTERNGGRGPWNHQFDVRISDVIKIGGKKQKHQIEVSLDIINFTNLINRNWGIQTFVPNVRNSSFQLIDFVGIENNTPNYRFNNPSGTPWQTDALNSRWQAQLGVRYSF